MTDPKNIIAKVLEIAEYKEDITAYVNTFISLSEDDAIATALANLPKEKQEEFSQRMNWVEGNDKILDLLNEYVTAKAYSDALKNATETAFFELLQSLQKTMTHTQKHSLQTYISSLNAS